jgi:hypothetical protein
MKRNCVRLSLFFVLLFSCLPAIASDVSLAWDQSISPHLCGNKIYVGTASRTYGSPITIGLQTTYTVTGLSSGTWYFAVTAFDCDGNESDFSNEVSQKIGSSTVPVTLYIQLQPIQTGPNIPFAIASMITTSQATIVWKTDVECSGTLYYGASAGNLNFSVKANNLGTTDHQATTYPLVSKTHYFYRVESVCNGQKIQSEIFSFNTK